MTYLEFCKKMVRDLGLKNSITTVTGQTGMNQKIVDWVADADNEIQTIWSDWDFLWAQYEETCIVGQLEYTKPSDLGTWDFDSFYLNYTSDDYVYLSMLDYRTWRKVYRQGTQTNDEPNLFVITPAKNIYLEPRPDDTHLLTADYWRSPTWMTANTDTSPIPSRFERIIIARAKIYYAEHEEFPTVFELATKEYADLLKRLEDAELPGRMAAMRKSSNFGLTVVPE